MPEKGPPITKETDRPTMLQEVCFMSSLETGHDTTCRAHTTHLRAATTQTEEGVPSYLDRGI